MLELNHDSQPPRFPDQDRFRTQEVHYSQVLVYDFETNQGYSLSGRRLEIPTMVTPSMPSNEEVAKYMAGEYGVALTPSRYVATSGACHKDKLPRRHFFMAAITGMERNFFQGNWQDLEDMLESPLDN